MAVAGLFTRRGVNRVLRFAFEPRVAPQAFDFRYQIHRHHTMPFKMNASGSGKHPTFAPINNVDILSAHFAVAGLLDVVVGQSIWRHLVRPGPRCGGFHLGLLLQRIQPERISSGF
jgi:hypothetical protein